MRLISVIKLFLLLLFVACSHKKVIKVENPTLAKTKELIQLIEDENKAPAYNFPFYSSARFIHDDFVESIYKELAIDSLENKPQYLFSNFQFNTYVFAQHHNNVIYINILVWDSLKPEIKRDLILHELGHWIGMIHPQSGCDKKYTVMCPLKFDTDNKPIEQDKTHFHQDFNYLVNLKERHSGF